MASLEAVTKSYRAKKAEVAKMRRKSENTLRETLSLKRRSSSGLVSLQRRKEALEREISHVSQLLNQYRSQKESISRLKVDAEERLKHQLDMQDSTRQQVDFGPAEDKASAQERLRLTEEAISELRAATREREVKEGRLEREIADLEKEMTRLESQVKKQAHVKPVLVNQLKTSEKAESDLRPRVKTLIKREEQTARTLQTLERKLAESKAKRRKPKKAKRVKRKPSRKTRTSRPMRRTASKGKARKGASTRSPRRKAGKTQRRMQPRRISTKRMRKSRGSRPKRK